MEPIAIVGMSCRLPGGISSAGSLWEALKQRRSVHTAKVPESRFNIDAYLHETLDRPGSFNVAGGYFLDGKAEDFDPSFFNMTPIEAMWLDPQQRKMLEVVYEAFESAGRTLQDVAGSNTAVFVGSFTSDYQQMSTKDGDFRHNYVATGVDTGIISARIGNVFDLKGPSFTINTACSSSIYAIHHACLALRARDCTAAVAGGVNLILTVDQHMNTAKLGILSPTSRCHTFDASADGYGRAEGAGALYLKRLSDAIRDGDPIRGVIRGSAVNTNGKVPGMGITHPDKHGQERVIRSVYERAGLDPSRTAYVEAHGTGTPVGDPIETQGIAKAMNDSRDSPLVVGAIKANIGHSEAASGIFAVMKAALMTEGAIIPGVAGLETVNPEIDEKGWNITIPKETMPWPANNAVVRRAGVSSFGYGGTNGHVVIESVHSLHPLYHHGQPRATSAYSYSKASQNRPYLLALSAHDKTTLERNIDAYARVVSEYHVPDLAYTLLSRRSRFPVRGFTVTSGSGDSIAQDFTPSSFTMGNAQKTAPSLCFVFTGQGAQWPRLGATAMAAFPYSLDVIQSLDRILHSPALDKQLQPTWRLEEALNGDPESGIDINDASIAQPVCTAVQIAIVDLLSTWNIVPAVTVGHSSGEIAAAYAAGRVSAPEAIIAAFLRGYAVKHHAPVGSMLAVGMGNQEVSARLPSDNSVVVACHNSPDSTTLSGTPAAISALAKQLQEEGLFARELATGKAYHSPHMEPVATVYEKLLDTALSRLAESDLEWRCPLVQWFSSVTGQEDIGDTVSPSYWSQNLRQRVLFEEAVTAVSSQLEDVRVMVEIGPHSALAGPLKQIFKSQGMSEQFKYIPTLIRGKDGARNLVETAGSLFVLDYPIDAEEVNAPLGADKKPRLLVDLPPYQWNYEKTFWSEPRLSHEQRHFTHARHDLLGRSMYGLSDQSLSWSNRLRHRDIPWLRDHRLGGESIFPAAGHLSMAAEGLRQVCDVREIPVESVTFRDVKISTALAIPESDDGIETQLRLTRVDQDWWRFSVQSLSEGQWTVHCEGSVTANLRGQEALREETHPVEESKLTRLASGKSWYDAFHRVGFEYTNSFQPLDDIRTDGTSQKAAATVRVGTESGLMRGESRYLLHPLTIDGCLQLIIISINSGLYNSMKHGVVPVKIDELTISPQHGEDASSGTGHGVAWTDHIDGRHFNTHSKLIMGDGTVALDVRNLVCVSYEAAVPQDSNNEPGARRPYAETVWRPDIDTLFTLPAALHKTEEDSIPYILECMHHKSPLGQVLFTGQSDNSLSDAASRQLSPEVKLRISDMIDMPSSKQEPEKVEVDDVVVFSHGHLTYGQGLFDNAAEAMSQGCRAIMTVPESADRDTLDEYLRRAGFTASQLCVPVQGGVVATCRYLGAPEINGVAKAKAVEIFTYPGTSTALSVPGLEQRGLVVDGTEIHHFAQRSSEKNEGSLFVIDDTQGKMLDNIDGETFDCLKTLLTSGVPTLWLTSGVNEGISTTAGMAQGLLRAIRSEVTSSRILLMDVDVDEGIDSITNAVADRLDHIRTKDSGDEVELWLRNGTLHIPRVLPSEELNAEFNADSASPQASVLDADQLLPLRGTFEDGELVFQADEHDLPPLAADEIQIRVDTSLIEAADLRVHPSGPRLVTGTVTAAGPGLDRDVIGRNVVTFTQDPFVTTVRAALSHCALYEVREHHGAALAAAVQALASAVHTVVNTGSVKAGEDVLLLLEGPDLSFVSAVAALERIIGFRLVVAVRTTAAMEAAVAKCNLSPASFIVASDSQRVRHQLGQKGIQPRVVISNAFNDVSKDVWRSMMAAGARFVLKSDEMGDHLDPAPFLRGASFSLASLKTLYKRQPEQLGGLLCQALEYLERDPLGQPFSTAATIHDVGSISPPQDGSGQVVVQFNYGTSMIKVRPLRRKVTFSPEGTYLLVGCLGGLGRSLTTFMLARGARDFVFLSRSGTDHASAKAVVQNLEDAGAKVRAFRGDATVLSDVERTVSEVTATGVPIRGVVHAAMVLDDGMYESMTHAQFARAVRPKVEGARNLDRALRDHALDFFVMTSSISATIGNPGQANYCAANAFLDALAWNRARRQGRPATSLVLPMVLDVGVVAENAHIEAALTRKAMYGIDEHEMLRGFETAMLHPQRAGAAASPQIILGLEPARLAAALKKAGGSSSNAYWYNDSRLSTLRAEVDRFAQAGNSNGNKQSGNGDDWAGVLEAARAQGSEAVLEAVGAHIIGKLSKMLLVPVEKFEMDGSSVAAYGLDSMIGAELRNWLHRQFSLEVTFQQLLSPAMTIRALSGAVDQRLEV
ncbi:polyketide synthase [Apiospora sp. TS-2023a]